MYTGHKKSDVSIPHLVGVQPSYEKCNLELAKISAKPAQLVPNLRALSTAV